MFVRFSVCSVLFFLHFHYNLFILYYVNFILVCCLLFYFCLNLYVVLFTIVNLFVVLCVCSYVFEFTCLRLFASCVGMCVYHANGNMLAFSLC